MCIQSIQYASLKCFRTESERARTHTQNCCEAINGMEFDLNVCEHSSFIHIDNLTVCLSNQRPYSINAMRASSDANEKPACQRPSTPRQWVYACRENGHEKVLYFGSLRKSARPFLYPWPRHCLREKVPVPSTTRNEGKRTQCSKQTFVSSLVSEIKESRLEGYVYVIP